MDRKNKPEFSVNWETSYKRACNSSSHFERLCLEKFPKSLEIRSDGEVHYCGILSSVKNVPLGNVIQRSICDIYSECIPLYEGMYFGCVALSLVSLRENGKMTDIRCGSDEWVPSCPYEIEKLS